MTIADQKDHNVSYTHGATNESRMVQEVRHQFVLLPYCSIFDDLAFQVDGSSVTLVGAVVRPTLKSDAENVVKRVEGVTQVNNQKEVLPLSEMDDQIRRAMVRTIYGDSQIGTRLLKPGSAFDSHPGEERQRDIPLLRLL